MSRFDLPDEKRCVVVTPEGRRCRLKREPRGDGSLCGVHLRKKRIQEEKAK